MFQYYRFKSIIWDYTVCQTVNPLCPVPSAISPHSLLRTMKLLACEEVVGFSSLHTLRSCLFAFRTCYTPLSVTRFTRPRMTPFIAEDKYDALQILEIVWFRVTEQAYILLDGAQLPTYIGFAETDMTLFNLYKIKLRSFSLNS